MRYLGGLVLSVAATAVGAADALRDMKPYPAPEDGVQRLVFRVPQVADESERRVEVLAGRTLEVDCNRHHFGGRLEARTAQGWGYPYHVLTGVSGPVATLMACPEGAAHEAFVRVHGNGFEIRYNSKLPVVVYVPEGFEVRYRIWAPSGEVGVAAPE